MRERDGCVVRNEENKSAAKTITFDVNDIARFLFRGQGIVGGVRRLRGGLSNAW